MRSPFKFLDAYTREDKGIFFGRTEEVDALQEMVAKNRLALIYGPSGAGKTSLVQCGLANRYHPTDWYPLFIRRNEDINRSLEEALANGLEEQPPGDIAQAIEALYVEYLRPVYLIFDQMEELLILGSEEEQQQFVKDIARIQQAQIPCRILFILREEYLAHLYNFEKAIPRLFTRRLRVEPMGRAGVREVITRSCAAFNIRFEDQEQNPEQAIDNLSRGKTGISLPYLQVYLDRLYKAAFKRTYQRDRQGEELPGLTFTTREIEELGAIENVLGQFLNEQQRLIQDRLKKEYPNITDGFTQQVLDVFVTERGTKRPVPFEVAGGLITVDDESYPFLASLPPEALTTCLKALQASRILNDKGNSYELAHDSLAALIDEARTEEQRRRNQAKKRIGNAYAEYRASGLLLNRKQLIGIEEVLEELEPALTPEVKAFIKESYEQAEQQEQAALEEERQKRRKAWRIATGFGVLALLALASAVFAIFQYQHAQAAARRAADKAFESSYLNAVLLKKEGEYPEAVKQIDALDIPGLRPSALDSLAGLRQTILKLGQYVSRGDSLAGAGDFREALAAFEQAYALSPDSILLRSVSQTELRLKTEFDRLIDFADAMVRAGPENYNRAITAYSRALELRPEHDATRRKLNELLGSK
ncbi:MAG: ATP-binding protein [Lewinellaceae bacterium]|nr:ATP-binding protein [Lewinellaceae bacterium]